MQEVLALCLASSFTSTCRQQWLVLESGGEESVFGYDFRRGTRAWSATSPPTGRRARAANRAGGSGGGRTGRQDAQRETKRREANSAAWTGCSRKSPRRASVLTEEERRFMKQFSDRYKNRHQYVGRARVASPSASRLSVLRHSRRRNQDDMPTSSSRAPSKGSAITCRS